MKKKKAKLPNLLQRIKECIEKGNYAFSKHALDRQNEREIDTTTALYILKTGYNEQKKDSYNDKYETWKYAIRGKTKDDDFEIRVIVALDEQEMLIITVMHII